MSNYEDKEQQLKYAKGFFSDQFYKLHPTDLAEAFREVETWASERAKKWEERNERDGVPERTST